MSCDVIGITLACWNSTQPLTTTMKATSAANCTSVISLLEQGYSVRDIEKRTGLEKSNVSRMKKGMHTVSRCQTEFYQLSNVNICCINLITYLT